MHSHLIPGIDDGVKSPREAFAVIDALMELGYQKIITTPHIMTDYYGNTAESVTTAFENFKVVLKESGYTIPFHCAAEYYLDENFIKIMMDKKRILTFGDRHFLFETNVMSEPYQLKEFIFSATSQGYKPVLAHPERYEYMSLEKAEDMRNRGVLLQINMLSLIGFYGPQIQKMAEKMIQKGLIDLLGSDCHNMDHALILKKVQQAKFYRKALDLPLLNYTL
ncbi:MAG: capsular biosynthesis protein [Cyclobacteriaceae bacterium]|nr:capsular biosynthesis protein [Cyclobacteriaceae bacterium]